MDTNMLIKLKNTPEMDADQHDGSYELMRAIVNSYRGVEESILDYNDLNAIYLMSVGTWKHGIPAKKQVIEKSHLADGAKAELKKLLVEIQAKSSRGEYTNHEATDNGLIGMFGTGFNSFQNKTNVKSAHSFIKMCIDISNMTDDEEIYERASHVLNKSFKGMRAASASMVLHCLKPNVFPILNSNMGSANIFAALDIKLKKKGEIDTYIENCRVIKSFRDSNLPFKNYRILDMAAWSLGEIDDPISEIIKKYKADFISWDKEERYKWEAIKCFQDNWDIEAKDFSEMLKQSLAKTSNLLTTGTIYAKGMIEYLALKNPDKVKGMFLNLYDENKDLVDRVNSFYDGAKELFEKHKDTSNPKMKQHYQQHNVICLYLFFKYPEKYYLYKFSKYKSFAEKIGYDEKISPGEGQNLIGYMEMCDAVLTKVLKDDKLQSMSKERLDPDCYSDPEFHMLADDIIYYGSKLDGTTLVTNEDGEEEDEMNKKANPILTPYNKNIILCGPPGTGKTYHSVNYAVAIIEDKPLDEVTAENHDVVLNRYNAHKEDGNIEFTTFHQSFGYEEFIEGIKPVLNSSDDDSDVTNISYVIADGIFKEFCERAMTPVIKQNNDYGFSEYPTVWKISLAGTGDNPVRKDCMKNNYIRIGWDEYGPSITDETIFHKGGKNVLNAFINRMQMGDIVLSCFSERTIDAIGIIVGDYEWNQKLKDYCRVRKVKWLVKDINYDIFEMNHNTVMTLSTVYRMNISVADVIMILNEKSTGEAILAETPKKCVFIIDEINRGNISKIFGELITLIEPTKRLGQPEALKVKLPYSQKSFGVPDNVYIVGTMNTADRSIALIDTALRRRFNFIETLPDVEVLSGIEVEGVSISDMLQKINRRIEVLSGREHMIGHSFFLDLKNTATLERLSCIFAQNLIPLLQEYFYEDYEKIRLVLGDSHKAADEQFVIEKQIDFSELFGGAEYDFDETPAYEIKADALMNINAYKNI